VKALARNDINLRIQARRKTLLDVNEIDQIKRRRRIIVDDDVDVARGDRLAACQGTEDVKRGDAGRFQRPSVEADQAANVVERHDDTIGQKTGKILQRCIYRTASNAAVTTARMTTVVALIVARCRQPTWRKAATDVPRPSAAIATSRPQLDAVTSTDLIGW
jgi:hypothetical protein